MIKEIHSWWAQNLRDIATTATTVPSETSQAHEVQLTTSSGPGCFAFAFEVYMVTGGVASLLCPEACLHDDRDETGSDLTQLFICRCHQINVPNRTAKHPSVENITRRFPIDLRTSVVGLRSVTSFTVVFPLSTGRGREVLDSLQSPRQVKQPSSFYNHQEPRS